MNHSKPAPPGALSGVNVLDLTRILAGPWCTQLLADFGADVIKIERPNVGDDTRSWGPPWILSEHSGACSGQPLYSSYFAAANRNKRSIALDISTPEGQGTLKSLVLEADILVENYKVGDLARYGLDYPSLSAINERLIYCSITGYGQSGPYANRPGYDFIFQGEAGLMSVTGEPENNGHGGPQKVGVAVSDLITGMYANSAILAALQARTLTGRGQHIDVALFDCTLAFGANLAFNQVAMNLTAKPYGNAHPVLVPYQVFQTKDGRLIVAAGNDSQWARFCKVIEREDLLNDDRFKSGPGRITHREILIPLLEDALRQKPTDHWVERLENEGLPHGRINDYKQAFEHPQAIHREMKVELEDGSIYVGNPIRFSETPVKYSQRPPKLGEHTEEILNNTRSQPDAK